MSGNHTSTPAAGPDAEQSAEPDARRRLQQEEALEAGVRRLWFLLPGANRHQAAVLAGSGVAVAILSVFLFSILLRHGSEATFAILLTPTVLATTIFFTASLSLLAGLAQVVFPAARDDFEALRADLDVDPAAQDRIAQALERMPLRPMLGSIPVAVAIGSLHVWLLGETTPHFGAWLAATICNLLLWIAMFQIALPLVRNARIFSLLGRCARVDLYRPGRLTPFGRTAIRPCLFIIALQCAYAVLVIPEGTSLLRGGAPLGLIASMGLVAGLFFLPLRGIREQIRSAREQALAAIDLRLAELGALAPPGASGTTMAELNDAASLLRLKDRITAVSAWPLGFEGFRRLAFYVVLVPMTWVGAALVEMLIDGRL